MPKKGLIFHPDRQQVQICPLSVEIPFYILSNN